MAAPHYHTICPRLTTATRLLVATILLAATASAITPAIAQEFDYSAERDRRGPSQASRPSRPGAEPDFGGGDAVETTQSPAIQALDSSFEEDDRTLEIVPPAQTRPGYRPVVQDGDLSYPPPPQFPRDGEIRVGEEAPVLDGVDPTSVDTRPEEDINLFESPPAGFDPLLFQIEDIEPRRDDRRPERLFRDEPYDPVGIKVGTFVFFPEVETGLRATTNVLSSPDPDSDIAYTLDPSARLVSNWSRHALEFNAEATLSFFNEFDTEDDRGYFLEARGRLDFTRRSNLQALISHDFSQESRSAIDASNTPDRTNVNTDRAAVTFNHRFNRLSVQLRGSLETRDFGDDIDNGVLISNADRNIDEWEQAVRATWEFKPTLSVFAEVGFIQREFGAPSQADDILRDSTGERYRVGLDFGDTGAYLRGEISVGYGIERPNTSQLQEVEAFLFDANASWRVSELTTLLLNARSDIEDTTTEGSGGVVTHFIGLEARHAFRRHLIGTAGMSISTRDFDATQFKEDEWRAEAGLEYFFNRNAVLFGTYEHTDFNSNDPGSSFVSDEFFVGMRFRR